MFVKLKIYLLTAAVIIFAGTASAQDPIEGKWKMTGYSFVNKKAFPIDQMEVNLNIDKTLRISGKAGCNNYYGSLAIESGGKIKTGPLTSTDMACDEIAGQFESLFLQTLENATLYSLDKGKLTFSDPKTKSFLRFERFEQAEESERQVLFVANKMVKCPGIAPMKCLQIKRAKSGVWQNFYDSIINFDYKPGIFYKIEVERKELDHVPQDTGIYRYRLVRVIRAVKKEKSLYY